MVHSEGGKKLYLLCHLFTNFFLLLFSKYTLSQILESYYLCNCSLPSSIRTNPNLLKLPRFSPRVSPQRQTCPSYRVSSRPITTRVCTRFSTSHKRPTRPSYGLFSRPLRTLTCPIFLSILKFTLSSCPPCPCPANSPVRSRRPAD